MEYYGKFGHTLGQIQKIALMSIIESCHKACCLETQTVAYTIPGSQGIKNFIQYLASNPHKTIIYIFNYYDNSNFIRFIWGGK